MIIVISELKMLIDYAIFIASEKSGNWKVPPCFSIWQSKIFKMENGLLYHWTPHSDVAENALTLHP
jgi:hypothetical protein